MALKFATQLRSWRNYIYYPWSNLFHSSKPSRLPYDCIQSVLPNVQLTKLNQPQEPSLPSKYPFTPWVKRSNYKAKCIAPGHKCHDRESNPHSYDLATKFKFKFKFKIGLFSYKNTRPNKKSQTNGIWLNIKLHQKYMT